MGSPPLQSGGQNQKWPTSGPGGYIATAACGMPTASQRGAESEVAHKWARWLHNPCRLGGPHRSQRGAESEVAHKWAGGYMALAGCGIPTASQRGQNQKWPTSGPGGYITPDACGSPPLHSGGQNEKWPTSGLGGYIATAACGMPTTSGRGAESEVAHKWAGWLHNPCRLWDPQRFRAGGRIRSGPQVGQVAP